MKKKKLLILTGITMSGKSTVKRALCDKFEDNQIYLKNIKPTTSRPPREKENEFSDYEFCTENKFIEKMSQGNFYSISYYDTLYGIWYYGLSKKTKFDRYNILISNPVEVKQLLYNLPKNIDVTIVNLSISKEAIFKRYDIGRGEKELENRIERDYKKYQDYSIYMRHNHQNIFHEIDCSNLTVCEICNTIHKYF